MKNLIITFVALIAGLLIGTGTTYQITKTNAQKITEKDNAQMKELEDKIAILKTGTQQTEGTEQTHIAELEKQLISLQQQAKEMDVERNTCLAKFDRDTILYDGILGDKKWLIHADIEPITFGVIPTARYSHYDPKTQIETVKIPAKHQ
ncbi:MAG TPA: hypothetical protein VKP61_08835 [Candidatus Acidoferrum sp.]|nr:hypothetical protein [Candidatus Acidoferrum sp.]